jgi:hypothetical protein
MSGVTVIPTNSTGLPNQNTNQYRNSRILELIAAGEELPLQENGTQGMPMYRYTFTVRTNTDVGQVCLFLHNGTSTRLAGVNSTYNTNGFLTQTREFTFTQNLSYEEWQNLRAEACVYYDGQPIRDREGAYKEIPVPAPGEGNAQVFSSTNQFMEQIMSFVRNMFSWNFRGASAE